MRVGDEELNGNVDHTQATTPLGHNGTHTVVACPRETVAAQLRRDLSGPAGFHPFRPAGTRSQATAPAATTQPLVLTSDLKLYQRSRSARSSDRIGPSVDSLFPKIVGKCRRARQIRTSRGRIVAARHRPLATRG